jgi:HK97 family phage major capsid protein
MSEHDNLETKAGATGVGAAFEDFMRAFEAFKETNDERLYSLERRSAADPLIEDKLTRIDRALDEHRRVVDDLALKAARPQIGGSAPRSGAALAHKSAFDAYVRKGEPGSLRDLERKALSVGSDPDGGYLVPDETENTVNRALKDISPIRAIAGIRQVSGSVYKRPFSVAGPATGWVAESASRPQTNAPTLAELAFPTTELYAMPAATASLLDDSAVNIDEWLAEEVRIAFAEQEGTAFVSGNGTIITGLSTVLPALGPAFGIDVTGDLVREAGEGIVQTVQAVGGLVGTIMTIYGRVRATKPLEQRNMQLKL